MSNEIFNILYNSGYLTLEEAQELLEKIMEVINY